MDLSQFTSPPQNVPEFLASGASESVDPPSAPIIEPAANTSSNDIGGVFGGVATDMADFSEFAPASTSAIDNAIGTVLMQDEDPFALSGMPVSSNVTVGSAAGAGSGRGEDGKEDISALRAWETKHEAELAEKATEEMELKKKRREEGSAEMAQWYEQRKQQITKKKAHNREEERNYIQLRDSFNQGDGNEWGKVTSMIDSSTIAEKNVSDTCRMKSLLFALKSNPPAVQT